MFEKTAVELKGRFPLFALLLRRGLFGKPRAQTDIERYKCYDV